MQSMQSNKSNSNNDPGRPQESTTLSMSRGTSGRPSRGLKTVKTVKTEMKDKNMTEWIKLDFGKHKGKTLPEVIFDDPDWFFYCFNAEFFKNYPALKAQAERINERARRIRIPRENDADDYRAQYWFEVKRENFVELVIVKEGEDIYHSSRIQVVTRAVIDLGLVCDWKNYAKSGNRLLVTEVKKILFGEKARMTKKRAEAFFDDDANFDLP